jgi:hypothetical protein
MTSSLLFIDHSVHIHRLSSWFGRNGTALSWLQSYLSSRNFVVNINVSSSAPLPLHQSVPQGSVLGPLLFILYTILLCSLISHSCVKHHLYADDFNCCLIFHVNVILHLKFNIFQNAEATITGTAHETLQQKDVRQYRNIMFTRVSVTWFLLMLVLRKVVLTPLAYQSGFCVTTACYGIILPVRSWKRSQMALSIAALVSKPLPKKDSCITKTVSFILDVWRICTIFHAISVISYFY